MEIKAIVKKFSAIIFSTLFAPPAPVFAPLASHGFELLLHFFFDHACMDWAVSNLVRGRVTRKTGLDNRFFVGFRSCQLRNIGVHIGDSLIYFEICTSPSPIVSQIVKRLGSFVTYNSTYIGILDTVRYDLNEIGVSVRVRISARILGIHIKAFSPIQICSIFLIKLLLQL